MSLFLVFKIVNVALFWSVILLNLYEQCPVIVLISDLRVSLCYSVRSSCNRNMNKHVKDTKQLSKHQYKVLIVAIQN